MQSALARLARDRLIAGLGWLGLAEIIVRVTRLAATVVLARLLLPEEFGIAAAALTVFEIVRVLSSAGLSQAVTRAPTPDLSATCNTAFRAAWAFAGAAVAVQLSIAAALWHITGRGDLAAMVATLAGVYLLQPWGLVEAGLLLRADGAKVVAMVAAAQIAADSLLTAGLAFAGWGAWAVVLPKLLTAPLWVLAVRQASPWARPSGSEPRLPTSAVVRFAIPVMGSDLLGAARLHLDKAIAGAILGVDALGIYYFAFNAGYGLSLTLTSALATAAFAHMAAASVSNAPIVPAFDRAIVRAVLPVCVLIVLQAAATVIYVPVLFGAKWAFAAPLVAILCLGAATKPLLDGASHMLRAIGCTHADFAGNLAFTTVMLGSLAIGFTFGLSAGVAVFAACATCGQITFAVWARVVALRHGRRP